MGCLLPSQFYTTIMANKVPNHHKWKLTAAKRKVLSVRAGKHESEQLGQIFTAVVTVTVTWPLQLLLVNTDDPCSEVEKCCWLLLNLWLILALFPFPSVWRITYWKPELSHLDKEAHNVNVSVYAFGSSRIILCNKMAVTVSFSKPTFLKLRLSMRHDSPLVQTTTTLWSL